MTVIASKSVGNIIASADFNAIVNKIQNATDTDIKISGSTTADVRLLQLVKNTTPATEPLVYLNQQAASQNVTVIDIFNSGIGSCIKAQDSGAGTMIYFDKNAAGFGFRLDYAGTDTAMYINCDGSGIGNRGLYISRSNNTANLPLAHFAEGSTTITSVPVVRIDQAGNYYAQTITTTNASNLYGGLYISCTGATDGSYPHAALGIDNTNNTGIGFWIYSAQGAGQNTALSQIQVNNAAFDQYALRILATSNGPLLEAQQMNASATATVLNLINSGTGFGEYINQTGTLADYRAALFVTTAINQNSTTTSLVNFLNNGATNNQTVCDIANNGTGIALSVKADGTMATNACGLAVRSTQARVNNYNYLITGWDNSASTWPMCAMRMSNASSTGSCYAAEHSGQGIGVEIITTTGSPLKLTPMSAPTNSLSAGCVYVNNTDKNLYIYDGSTWRSVGMSYTTKQMKMYPVSTTGGAGCPVAQMPSTGTWTQIVPASTITNDFIIVGLVVAPGAPNGANNVEWTLDIGTGGSGSETVIASTGGRADDNDTENTVTPTMLTVPIKVTANTRVAGRAQCGWSSWDTSCSVRILYYELPL